MIPGNANIVSRGARTAFLEAVHGTVNFQTHTVCSIMF